jgi:uncharacterized protein YjbI with pentapeptide repeats
MANEEQLKLLKTNIDDWNKWRGQNQNRMVDLSNADLFEADLSGANLGGTNHLNSANLSGANLCKANLSRTNLYKAHLRHAFLREARLVGTNLMEAKLGEANLSEADLTRANLSGADLMGANLNGANFSKADLSGALLDGVNFSKTNLSGANLSRSSLFNANFSGVNLFEANLRHAMLIGADFSRANLSRADLKGADLSKTNLIGVNLSGANLCDVKLIASHLVQANISSAKISRSHVYAVNVWDLEGEFESQEELIITQPGESVITVDNIKVAQFIYLILNNKEIRDVINTLTSKTVLILGRFALPERKAILDALRNKLREYDLLPIVFDFERPTDKDFTETIKTLAGISYFVIADVTNPKSSPLELQATIPDYQIPFVPIIQENEFPFAMMIDLQKKYSWVLDTITYDSLDTLLRILKPLIIDPAIKKRDELRIIKAKLPTIISGHYSLSKP